MRSRGRLLGAVALTGMGLAALLDVAGATPTGELPAVTVSDGRPPASATQVADDVSALPASTTVIERRALERRTVTTYGDLFRDVTGMSVADYGQGLVAYEIKLRGFASGHGRDVAFFLDGVPLNVTGSQHTNGYADLAQLVPELLSRVEIVRGPFSVLAGNHAVGGSVQLFTDANPRTSVTASVDTFGRARTVPIVNVTAGPGQWLLAADLTRGGGETRQGEVERHHLLTRYRLPVGEGVASLRLQAYDARADAPGYLDFARLRAGTIDRRAALSTGIGDAKRQQSLVLNWTSNDVDGSGPGAAGGWFVSVYATRDERRRWTNFDLTTPAGASAPLGAERDRLRQVGFDVRRTVTGTLAGAPAQGFVGLQWNDERVDALNFATDGARVPTGAVGVSRVVETRTRAAYLQGQWAPVPSLKLTAGLRWDQLDFRIGLRPDDDTFAAAAPLGLASVEASAVRASPKLGAAWALHDGGGHRLEAIANAARGLKSPYPFADFLGNLGVGGRVPSLSISPVTSLEAGLQGRATDGRWRWRATAWNTRQEREVSRNAAGFLQSFARTDRDGVDVEASVFVTPATRVFGNASAVRARAVDAPGGADRLPNVPERVATLGVESQQAWAGHRLDLTLFATRVGPQPLTADGALRGGAFVRTVLRVGWSHPAWPNVAAFAQVIHVDRPLNEVQFDFGGGAIGVAPRPPWQGIVGLRVTL